MASEMDLREQVERLIEPWLDSIYKPPFKEEELIVMVLIKCGEPMEEQSIHQWLFDNFKYYRKLALDLLWHHERVKDEEIGDPTSFKQAFHQAFHQFEVPLRAVFDDEGLEKWTVPSIEARIFLKHLLDPPQEQSFAFLRLPAEIRLRIYDMLFGLPRAGIAFTFGWPIDFNFVPSPRLVREFRALSKDLHEPVMVEDWYDYDSRDQRTFYCRLPNILLALLQVNKQIHREAMPVFFNNNHFAFRSASDMYEFLGRMSKVRRKHIHHMSLGLHPVCNKWMSPQTPYPTHLLSQCTGLKVLDVHAHDANIAEEADVLEAGVSSLGDILNIVDCELVKVHARDPNVKAELEKKLADRKLRESLASTAV